MEYFTQPGVLADHAAKYHLAYGRVVFTHLADTGILRCANRNGHRDHAADSGNDSRA